MALPVYGSVHIHVRNSSSRTVDETKPQPRWGPRGGCNQLKNRVFGSQAGKAAPKRIQQVVCVCGRAGNQLMLPDIGLDVLKLVVKLLLVARLALKGE